MVNEFFTIHRTKIYNFVINICEDISLYCFNIKHMYFGFLKFKRRNVKREGKRGRKVERESGGIGRETEEGKG